MLRKKPRQGWTRYRQNQNMSNKTCLICEIKQNKHTFSVRVGWKVGHTLVNLQPEGSIYCHTNFKSQIIPPTKKRGIAVIEVGVFLLCSFLLFSLFCNFFFFSDEE